MGEEKGTGTMNAKARHEIESLGPTWYNVGPRRNDNRKEVGSRFKGGRGRSSKRKEQKNRGGIWRGETLGWKFWRFGIKKRRKKLA